ncbi:MAG: sensor histidine kinase [Lachnospiraceae bacterium]
MKGLLWAYIKQHMAVVIMFFIFCGIFAGVFSLYNLEAEAVVYASGLCILVTFAFFIYHFRQYLKRHRGLMRLKKSIELLEERLPDSQGIIEADYQDIIEDLREVNNSLRTREQILRRDSIEYYMTWAHQIKTPISAMRLILQSEDTPEHEELRFELFRIEQYVEMVLSYFRLDSTASDFVIREYDLDDIIKPVIRKFAPQFIRKRIQLIYEKTDAVVLTDEKWLGFILEQILSNAIKYTDSGTVIIAIDEQNILSVTDTGMGIAAGDIPRIFEHGFTGYNGRADKKATGLGLYLCRKAADKLSHDIRVQSEAGKGTTVFVDLHKAELDIE